MGKIAVQCTDPNASCSIEVSDEGVVVENSYDCTDIVESAKCDRTVGKGSFMRKGCWGHPVARVPLILLRKWQEEWEAQGLDEEEQGAALMAKLGSSEYSDLRLTEARL